MRGSLKVAGVVAGTGLLAATMFGGVASADPVGTPGTPNCHGQRVSHGSSNSPVHEGHGITPKDRAGFLSEILSYYLGEPTTVSVKQFHQWVRFNCDSPGPQFDLTTLLPD
jgi:hypothetical protein